jgi:NarL family two-component system response regulator LiaR
MEQIKKPPDIIILDIALGTEDGLEFIPILKETCVKRKTALPGILVCSMYENPFLIQRAMDAGARAYAAKSSESAEIIAAIDALLAGGTYVNPKYHIRAHQQAWSALTRRENAIVSLVQQSLNTRQIAKHLGISVRTVENHLAHIYVKTNAHSLEDLMKL